MEEEEESKVELFSRIPVFSDDEDVGDEEEKVVKLSAGNEKEPNHPNPDFFMSDSPLKSNQSDNAAAAATATAVGYETTLSDRASAWTSWTSEKLYNLSSITQNITQDLFLKEQEADDYSLKKPNTKTTLNQQNIPPISSPPSDLTSMTFTSVPRMEEKESESSRSPTFESAITFESSTKPIEAVGSSSSHPSGMFARELESELSSLLKSASEGTVKLHELNPFDIKNHLLQDLFNQMNSRDHKLSKEVERLRSHLIELQDSNTDELMALQDEIDSLKNENIKLSQKVTEFLDPKNDKSALENENKTLTLKLEQLSRELEESKLSNSNFQSVLETIEAEKASESEIMLLEWKRKAREDMAAIEMLKSENSNLKERLSNQSAEGVIFQKLKSDLLSRDRLIDELNEEVNELKRTIAMLKDAKEDKDVDNFLDRKVIANLLFSLLSYYGRDVRKSREILLVMSGILPFDAIQRDALQLPPVAAPAKSDIELREYMRDSLGSGGRDIISSGKGNPPSNSNKYSADLGLADQFLSFLLRESRTTRDEVEYEEDLKKEVDYKGDYNHSFDNNDSTSDQVSNLVTIRPSTSLSINTTAPIIDPVTSVAEKIINSPTL